MTRPGYHNSVLSIMDRPAIISDNCVKKVSKEVPPYVVLSTQLVFDTNDIVQPFCI